MAIDIKSLPQAAAKAHNDGTTSGSSARKDNPVEPAKIATQPSDNVKITKDAEYMKLMDDSLKLESDIDIERISHIKTQIENGLYNVDMRRVAEKFINFESQLER